MFNSEIKYFWTKVLPPWKDFSWLLFGLPVGPLRPVTPMQVKTQLNQVETPA